MSRKQLRIEIFFVMVYVLYITFQAFAGERGDAFKKGHEATDNNEAIKWYKKALELCKENEVVPKAWAYNNIGFVYIKMGKWDEALENLEKSVKECNKIDVAWNNLGIIYENMAFLNKDKEKMKELLESSKDAYVKAIELKPDKEKYQINKTRVEDLLKNK